MKKKILLLSVLGSLAFFNSCQDDFMEFDPSNSIDAEGSITNEAQLENAVLGLYDGLQNNYVYGNYLLTAQEILSDNGFVILDNSNRFTDFNNYTHAISGGGSIANMWTTMYRVIARSNNVLSYENTIKGSDIPGKMAEARAIRALVMFNLVNLYARPYGTINQDLGIPVPTKFVVGKELKRSSVEEVYKQIVEDLDFAAKNLKQSNSARLNKAAVHGLLSRVYLFKKDYKNAILNADIALASSGFVAGADLQEYYKDPTKYNETLFAIDFSPLDNPGANDALGAVWTVGGRYEQNMASLDFFSLMDDNDSRKELYLEMTDLPDNPVPYGVLKFGNDDNDVVVLRSSEVLLNKIEALYHVNPSMALTELTSWVKNFRQSDYAFSGTGQALFDEILRQRRIELAFEGHRLFDLNRLEMAVEKSKGNVNQNPVVPFNDYKRVFPIPIAEMNSNPLMIQNPTYK